MNKFRKSMATVMFAAGLGLVVAAPAGAQEAPPPEPNCEGAFGTISASDTSLQPGQSVTVSGTGFRANSTITLRMETEPWTASYLVGTTTTNGAGAFTTTVTVPTNIPSGTYRLRAFVAGCEPRHVRVIVEVGAYDTTTTTTTTVLEPGPTTVPAQPTTTMPEETTTTMPEDTTTTTAVVAPTTLVQDTTTTMVVTVPVPVGVLPTTEVRGDLVYQPDVTVLGRTQVQGEQLAYTGTSPLMVVGALASVLLGAGLLITRRRVLQEF